MTSHVLQCGVIVAVLAFLALQFPAAMTRLAGGIIRQLTWLARRKTLCWIAVGAFVLLLRAALLPVWPIPKPVIYDEFSYLLQADTFAHGRLATLTHPLWQFFESIYVLQQPSYASKYPPGQSLFMALGQVLFGHPWFGVWLSAGLMAAALCWALQGWLPPRWALLGVAIAGQVCIIGYWMNSYWGGAAAAIGGALVVGSWPRIVRKGQVRYSWALAAGAVLLVLTRPYEGLLLLMPVLIALLRRNRALACWGPLMVVGILGAAWLGYYNFRVTGSALRLPYQEYFSQYETTPPFNILPLAASRHFRHFNLAYLDHGYALDLYQKSRSAALLTSRPMDWYRALKEILGDTVWLLPLIMMAPVLFQVRRTRPIMILFAVIVTGSLIEVPFFPHYGAPFTIVMLLAAVESLRALQTWKYGGRRVGLFLVRALPAATLLVILGNDALLIARHQTSDAVQPINSHRGEMAQQLLEDHPGKHVIFVHYSGLQSPHEEWIYNPANIDESPVVWAQDMGADNQLLMNYYRDRSFWFLDPDQRPLLVTPYAAAH